MTPTNQEETNLVQSDKAIIEALEWTLKMSLTQIPPFVLDDFVLDPYEHGFEIDDGPLLHYSQYRGYIEKENRVIGLFLQGLGLDHIPECIAGLTELQAFSLSGRYHERLTGYTTIRPIKHLKVLDISLLTDLIKLRILDLSYLEFEAIDLTPLAYLTNLKTINLSRNDLQTIDLTPLEQCKQLTNLSLKYNSLKKLNLNPLQELEKLTYFDIDNNQIEDLDVTPLIRLTNLECTINKFHNIQMYSKPVAFEYVSNFLEHYFSKINWKTSEIEEHEKDLFTQYLDSLRNSNLKVSWPTYKRRQLTRKLGSTNCFSLEENRFIKPPNNDIDPETNLYRTELQILKELETEIDHLLEKFDPSKYFPQGYEEKNHRIVVLRLQSLYLNTIPNTIGKLMFLEELDLSMNDLQKADLRLIRECTRLKKIDLDFNQLQLIDLSIFQNFLNFSSLDIHANNLQSIDLTPLQNCPNFSTLNLGSNKLQSIDLNPLQNCPNFSALHLGSNKLQSIDLNPLNNLSGFSSLSLRDNKLTQINLIPLHQLFNLSYLGLGSNNLTHIDLSPLEYCKKLKAISLESNKLSELDLSPITSIETSLAIYLKNNRLKELDITSLLTIPNLEELAIEKGVQIIASPMPLFYTANFLRIWLKHINWLMDDTNSRERELYQQYQQRVTHFELCESWVDFRDRKLTDSNTDSERFLDTMIEQFLTIKDLPITHVDINTQRQWWRAIEKRLEIRNFGQTNFLNGTDLVSTLQEYYLPGCENNLAIIFVEGDPLKSILSEIQLFRYWYYKYTASGWIPNQVYLISWARIEVWEDKKHYRVVCGFNRGYMTPVASNPHQLEPFQPKVYPTYPYGLYVTIEVSYEHHNYVTDDPLHLLDEIGSWLSFERIVQGTEHWFGSLQT